VAVMLFPGCFCLCCHAQNQLVISFQDDREEGGLKRQRPEVGAVSPVTTHTAGTPGHLPASSVEWV
jgi:hypothetical protein